jgi:hypothetical protein
MKDVLSKEFVNFKISGNKLIKQAPKSSLLVELEKQWTKEGNKMH